MHNNDAYLNNLLSSCDITWRLSTYWQDSIYNICQTKLEGLMKRVFLSQSISYGKIQLEVNGFIVKELRYSLLKGKLYSFSWVSSCKCSYTPTHAWGYSYTYMNLWCMHAYTYMVYPYTYMNLWCMHTPGISNETISSSVMNSDHGAG